MQWRSMVALGVLAMSLQVVAQPVADSAATVAVPAVSTWPAQLRMQVPFEPTVVPSNGANRLLYELYLTNFGGDPIAVERIDFLDAVEGAPVGTHHTVLKHLGPPVQGANWLAADGPGNGRYNHHRRGILVNDGALSNSRRFAVDWKPGRDDATFTGDAHADAAYSPTASPCSR